jgi:acyl carrier protein
MTRAEIHDGVTQALIFVAPELASARLKADVPLRDQVDLDSMDFLRFVMELHRRFGIEVPETDYQALASLSGAINYIAGRSSDDPHREATVAG